MCNLQHVTTKVLRRTLTQEIQALLPPNTDPNIERRVQIIVPPTPTVYIALDLPEEDVMSNKTYNLPPLHPGNFVDFPLGKDQQLYGACAVGTATITLVIEHYLVEKSA